MAQNKIAVFFKRPTSDKEIDKIYFAPFIKKYIEQAPTRFIKGKGESVSKSTITTLKKIRKIRENIQNPYQNEFDKLKFNSVTLLKYFYKKASKRISISLIVLLKFI